MSVSAWTDYRKHPRQTAGALRWKCIVDPSEDGLFRGNLFTLAMITAGGFENGTKFEHTQTGEIRVWQGQGLFKDMFASFKKYRVQATSVEDFLARYYRKDRYTGRGPDYAAALLAAHQRDFEQDGYDIISHHDSVTGEVVAFYGDETYCQCKNGPAKIGPGVLLVCDHCGKKPKPAVG